MARNDAAARELIDQMDMALGSADESWRRSLPIRDRGEKLFHLNVMKVRVQKAIRLGNDAIDLAKRPETCKTLGALLVKAVEAENMVLVATGRVKCLSELEGEDF